MTVSCPGRHDEVAPTAESSGDLADVAHDHLGASRPFAADNGPEDDALVRPAPREGSAAERDRRAALAEILREAAAAFEDVEIDHMLAELRARRRDP